MSSSGSEVRADPKADRVVDLALRGGGQRRGATLAAWAYSMAGVTAVAIAVIGAYRQEWAIVAMGLLGLVIVGATAPLSLGRSGGAGGRDQELLIREIRNLHKAIVHMAEEQALSDDARRVLNRERERRLLCDAIEEDMMNENWDAAMVLVKELAERFGFRAEAEDFRERIEQARFATMERRVGAAIQNLDQLIREHRWQEAERESARISRLYPDSPRVEGLRHRVHEARQRYKEDLERRFLTAAHEDRIEEAMELLEELDQYLTEQEARQFEEVARGVIGKARENLGAQFKLAVHDRQWKLAAELGTRIIDQFPNTRMAEEVRSVIDGIREKAATITI